MNLCFSRFFIIVTGVLDKTCVIVNIFWSRKLAFGWAWLRLLEAGSVIRCLFLRVNTEQSSFLIRPFNLGVGAL